MLLRCLILLTFTLCTAVHAGQWRYQEDVDKMTGKKAAYAQLDSDNSLRLSSPYAGRNHGNITVRRHPAYGVDVLVSVEKGQILCRPFRNCTIMVKFGSGAPQAYSVLESEDNSSETMFIENRARFIAAARKHTKILIQLPMHQEGEQVLEFSTPVELVWK